jgi:hypothetical protein
MRKPSCRIMMLGVMVTALAAAAERWLRFSFPLPDHAYGAEQNIESADVVIYGGTSAGIIAAVNTCEREKTGHSPGSQ